MRKLLLVLILLFSFLIQSCGKVNDAQEVMVDTSGLILSDLNNNPVSLNNLDGKPTVLFFWTTWCPYCRKELQDLNSTYAKYEQEGLTVYPISVGEQAQKVRNFAENLGLNFKILLDENGKVADAYNVLGVPTFILLNKEKEVVSESHTFPRDYQKLLN